MKSVCLIEPGEFRRFPWHWGFKYGWFQAWEKRLLSKPRHIVASSAGSLESAANLPWTLENFYKTFKTTRDLKTNQIYRLPRSMSGLLLLSAATALFPFLKLKQQISGQDIQDQNFFERNKDILLHVAEAAVTLGIESYIVNKFLKRSSIFDNTPLRRLLESKKDGVDFDAVFDSDIKFDIMTTDMLANEPVVFTNYRPEDKNLPKPDRDRRFVSALMASTSLAGHFKNEIIDGKVLGDSAYVTNIPLDQALKSKCDVIVIMLYTPIKEAVKSMPKSWIFDIVRANHISQSQTAFWRLRYFQTQKENPENDLPEVYIVESKYPVRELNFREFKTEDMLEGISLGYLTFQESLPQLRKLIA